MKLVTCSALLLTAACAGAAQPPDQPATLAPALARAQAVLADSTGRRVGVATFVEREDGVSIGVSVTGLPPGSHGLHIHERGACEAPSFESAGGHFNPGNDAHGSEAEGGPHAGDLPNLVVYEHGTGRTSAHLEEITLRDGENSIIEGDGTALIVHEKADDYITQPSGDAGGRLACGVIEAS